MKKLLLASASPYRRKLLQQLRVPFETASPDLDETRLPDESAAAMTGRLARAKARALAGDYPTHLIIGSDQAATLDSHILGKPGDTRTAVAQLTACSGREVTFYTSVCLLDGAGGELAEELVLTRVRFRALSRQEIEGYVAIERPLDCAGSFKCESLGISLFESIESDDPTALVGLPLIALTGLLQQFGLNPLANRVPL